MIIGVVDPPCRSTDKPDITINFERDVPSGGSVSTAVVTVLRASDLVDVSGTNKSGAHAVASPRVTQMLQLITVDLFVVIAATMSTGRVVTHEVLVPAAVLEAL